MWAGVAPGWGWPLQAGGVRPARCGCASRCPSTLTAAAATSAPHPPPACPSASGLARPPPPAAQRSRLGPGPAAGTNPTQMQDGAARRRMHGAGWHGTARGTAAGPRRARARESRQGCWPGHRGSPAAAKMAPRRRGARSPPNRRGSWRRLGPGRPCAAGHGKAGSAGRWAA